MKFIIILTIFFSLSNTIAQDYHFNIMTTYSTTYKDFHSIKLSYSNTEDNGFSLSIIEENKKFNARLLDFNTKKIHYFKINEVITDDGIVNNFIYEKTEELYNPSDKMYCKYVFDFKLFSVEDDIKKGQLYIYRNSKKKKAVNIFDIELRSFNSNLFHAFRTSCLHPFELLNNIGISENGIVLNAKSHNKRGDGVEHNLVSHKEINLILQIP